MSRPRWSAGLGALLAVAVALAVAGCSGGDGGGNDWKDDCATTDGIVECAPEHRPAAPPVSGELLTGGTYDLAGERGRVVVVNFWGSWCAPCRAEADDLEATYQATKDRDVRFLGINIQDGRDKAKAFEAAYKVSYPSLFDPPASCSPATRATIGSSVSRVVPARITTAIRFSRSSTMVAGIEFGGMSKASASRLGGSKMLG